MSEKHPMEQIANESPEAVGLIATLMEHSAREREGIEESIRGSLEREVEIWRARALDAEERLNRVEARLSWILR